MGQFKLLSEFADMKFLPTMGTPVDSPEVVAKPKGKAANDEESNRGQQPVQAETTRDKQQRAEEVDEAYTKMFSALSTKGIERLLTENNEKIDHLTDLIADWYKYTRLQNMLARAKESDPALAANDDDGVMQSSESDSSDSGDTFVDGPDKDKKKKQKRKRKQRNRKSNRSRRTRGSSRTRRSPRPSPTRGPRPTRGGKWSKLGAMLSKGKGAAKLALMSGLGVFGVDAVSDLAAPSAPKTIGADAEVSRGKPTLKVDGANATQEAGLLKRTGLTKMLGKANGALTVGLAAKDMYDISQDPTLTDAEKNKAYTKTGFGAAGSAMGGYAGAALGATIGSVVPVVGTVIGGVIGGILGSIGGSMAGEAVGEQVYNVVVDAQDAWKDADRKREFTVNMEGEELAKLNTNAEIARKSGMTQQQASQLSGYVTGQYNSKPGMSNYPVSGYSYQTAAPQPAVAQIDYRENAQYIPGQGVLKNLPAHDKRDAKLSNFDGIFEQKGQKYNLDPTLLRAVAKQESGGNPNAVSYVGAGGLMQLMPATGAEMGVTNRFDPSQSVDGGAKYLSKQMEKYGDTKLALAAYNAGPGNIDKAIKKAGTRDPDAVLAMLPQVTGRHAAETQQYVRNITGFHKEYKNLASQASVDKVDTAMPEVVRQQVDAERNTPALESEVVVPREDTSSKILAQTTVPDQQPVAQEPARKNKAVPTMLARPQVTARQSSGSGGASLDDMPLLLTEMGLGSMLAGEV